MITIDQYYMGRDKQYPVLLTPELKSNAEKTVTLVNKLLEESAKDGVTHDINPTTKSNVSSGWRPPAVNAGIPNAAAKSKHMTCQACDIYDPDGELDDWCMENQAKLASIGLWLENPASTKGWCHVQTLPPRSGKRVFYP
jgi:hypothetical protein